MTRLTCWILILFPALICQAQAERMRELYFGAAGKAGITAYYKEAVLLQTTDPLLLAYQGVAIAMYAEVVSGVGQKFEYFDKGKDLIERAAAQAPQNVEIAFLRFSVQSEVPSFLGYRSNLQDDANKVVAALRARQVPAGDPFWSKALAFMKKSGRLNKLQLAEINRYLTT